jgi:hypothetical protein
VVLLMVKAAICMSVGDLVSLNELLRLVNCVVMINKKKTEEAVQFVTVNSRW